MKSQNEFQTEQDVSTLHSAMKIKKDPKRMKAARSMMKDMMAGLDDAAQKLVKGKK